KKTRTLIFSDSFENGLSNWVIEQMPGGTVGLKDDKLEINDAKGCTVWLKKDFSGSIMIEYEAEIIKNGGENDRVSDMNCFWMASDPESPDNLFAKSDWRKGRFANYDSLQLYYIGMGGHNNTKTRFRRYSGNGEKPLLPQYD